MSEAISNSTVIQMQCLDQHQSFSNFNPVISDDDQSSGPEENDEPEESFDNRSDERLSVQDIIHYFETKAEVSMSGTKVDVERDRRQRPSIASPEGPVATTRCRAAPINEVNQVYIHNQTSMTKGFSPPAYSHDYSESALQARKMDVPSQSNKFKKDNQLVQDHSCLLSSEGYMFSSHASWIDVQSNTANKSTSTLCNNVSVPYDSDGGNCIHSNDFIPAYETVMKTEQQLACDRKSRIRSENLQLLLACDIFPNNGDNLPKLPKYETEIFGHMNEYVHSKTVGASYGSSFAIPERRGVWDPILEAHTYLTNDLHFKLTGQWKDLREVEQTVSETDSFLDLAKFIPKERADNSWSRNLNVEAESIICQVGDALHVDPRQCNEEKPPDFDDLFMIAERSFGECNGNRSNMLPKDNYDVKLTTDSSYTYEKNSKQREENPGQYMSAKSKLDVPTGLKTLNTMYSGTRGKDFLITGSQLPVRNAKSFKNDTDVASRGGVQNYYQGGNLPKAKTGKETAKRVARPGGTDRLPVKPPNALRSSTSSSTTGKAPVGRILDPNRSSKQPSPTDAHLARNTHKQSHLKKIVNRSVSVTETPTSRVHVMRNGNKER